MVDAPLALYRRYRPDTFAAVIGQAHVSEPLSHALDSNRVHHAYLFSGPRGCGKTTSARIMARALNCEQGPTSVPCGVCDSCVELASGGPGSLDVIEIDAASHGGVDDARELRERAFFSPVKARYKVYIIDEAHMVSPQGFNALLKLVEEPPAHLRFIFATTEPDKVIGTIRSRTHHYPFRLVPPKILGDYLVELSRLEGVQLEATVVPLIVRAGAGSVRDSLSVLDQLIGGSGPEGVTYALATALLGFTPASLLDETVDALAADDGGTLFGVIDKVVDSGQDPRRFAEDLLHRLRDLVIVSAVPNAAARGLIEVSDDTAERLDGQAQRFGRAELTRAADIVSQGLTDMRGATAPRLLLEMMCARILLPGVDHTAEGLGARLDRIERRLSVVGGGPPTVDRADAPAGPAPAALIPEPAPAAPEQPAAPAEDTSWPESRRPGAVSASAAEPPADAPPIAAAAAVTAPPGQLGLVDVRQLWPGVLERVKTIKRFTWMTLSGKGQVKSVGDGVISIGLPTGARENFLRGGHDEILHQALIDELGVDWKVEVIVDDGGSDQASPRSARPPVSQPAPAESKDPAVARTKEVEAAKAAMRSTRSPDGRDARSSSAEPAVQADVAEDDVVLDDADLTSQELLARELGAEVIEDIRHESA